MSKDTGGPAFPTVMVGKPEGGMTLRDYFAATAMQSMNGRSDYEDASAILIAVDAYALADAMLEARKK